MYYFIISFRKHYGRIRGVSRARAIRVAHAPHSGGQNSTSVMSYGVPTCHLLHGAASV